MNLINRVLIRRGVVCRVFTSTFIVLYALFAGPSPLLAANKAEPTDKDRVPEGISASDWQSIRAAHEAWKHAIEPVQGGWQARNSAQQWTTKFDGRGFEAEPQSAEWTWGLELRSYGAGDEQREVSGKPEVKTEGHRLAYHWDETVQEWYVNDGRGLEHGFSVQERPPGPSDAPLTFVLATRGPLRAAVTGDARAVDYRDKSGATVLTYSGLRVWDADGRELEARFAPAKSGVTLQVDAKDARYPLLIDPLAQQAYLKASNTGAIDFFGRSVDISGDTVVVGAEAEDSGFANNQNDNTATSAGAAYVFVRSGGTWTQQAYLKASNVDNSDSFGCSVAIDGDTIVVGAQGESSSATSVDGNQNDEGESLSGAAYVFTRSGGTWTQQAYLKSFKSRSGDAFGASVAILGDTVAVGAPLDDSDGTSILTTAPMSFTAADSGAVCVFTRSGTTWTAQAYLKAANAGAGDRFGSAVALGLSGNRLLVGAPNEDSNTLGPRTSASGQTDNSATDAGAAYVFARSSGVWTQGHYFKAFNTGAGDNFGASVDMFGGYAVVGAPNEDSAATGIDGNGADNTATDRGAAYVFSIGAGNFASAQENYLKSSNARARNFGKSVSIGDAALVVGSPSESNLATGINGNQNANGATDVGAAYVFVRRTTDLLPWSQQAYLKASNAEEGDGFGWSVAISDSTVVVGAPDEDGNSTGGQTDNSAAQSGAAYVLTGFGMAPVIQGFLSLPSGQVGTAYSHQISATAAAGVDSYGATGLPAGLSVNPTTGAITGTPTMAGSFDVTLSATNVGGTGTRTQNLTIAAVNMAAPVITSAGTANGLLGTAFNYQIMASGSPTSYAASGLPPGLSINTATGAIAGTPTVAGTFAVTISATNASGTGAKTLTIDILPPAPSISSAGTANGQVGTAFSYQITTSGGTATSYAATGLPAGLYLNKATGAITGTPAAAGTLAVEISAINAGGTDKKMLNLTITAVNMATPVISSATTANAQSPTAFSYQIVASGSPTSYGATGTVPGTSGLPTGLSLNETTGLISGTPADFPGNYTTVLSASNGSGTGTATLTITVLPAVPAIDSAATANGQVGTTFSYQITTTFLSGAIASYGATGLPAGLSINTTTGAITGTPSAAGTASVTLSAANASGTGTKILTLTIASSGGGGGGGGGSGGGGSAPGITAPAISSASTANGQVGAAFNYQITTTGGTPASYGATGLPSGLVVNTTTGAITGTPTAAGTSSVTVSATNAGGTATATLSLTVSPAPPVISSAATANGQLGTAFSYQITTTGGTPTSYGATGLPAGLGIDAATGAITGTPTAEGPSSVTISATNAGGTGTAILALEIAADVASLKVAPRTRTVMAGKPTTVTLQVGNDLTRAQSVRVSFSSGNATNVPAPASFTFNAPGKKKATQRPRLTSRPVVVSVPAVATAGTNVITAIVGDQSASFNLVVRPKRR